MPAPYRTRTGQAVLHFSQRRLKHLSSKLIYILAMAIFGTIGLFVRLIPLPSSMIALVRAAMGALFLLGMILSQKRKPDWAGIRCNWKPLLLSSLAMATEWILLFESYRYTTVAIATLCYYMSAVFVLIAAPFLLNEKLTAHKAVCAAAAVIGMVLVSGVPEGQAGSFSPVGVALGLTAAVFYAVIVLCNKRVKNVSSYDTTFIQLFAVTLLLLPYVLLTEDLALFGTLKPLGLAMLLSVGAVHTGIAYAMYFSSLQKIKAQTAALFSYLDPVIALLLSIFVLKEGMTVLGLIGAVIVLGAMLLSEREPKKS